MLFLGESEGSLPPPHDSFPDAGEATDDFWSMSGNFIHRHHVERRVKLYSPREESFPLPLKYITYPEQLKRIWMSSKSDAPMMMGLSMGQEIFFFETERLKQNQQNSQQTTSQRGH